MAIVTIFGAGNKQPGVYESGVQALPLDDNWAKIACSRDDMSTLPVDEEVFKVKLWISLDGGVTWPHHIGFGCMGGDHDIGNGRGISTESFFFMRIPGAGNPARRVKGAIELTRAMKITVWVETGTVP